MKTSNKNIYLIEDSGGGLTLQTNDNKFAAYFNDPKQAANVVLQIFDQNFTDFSDWDNDRDAALDLDDLHPSCFAITLANIADEAQDYDDDGDHDYGEAMRIVMRDIHAKLETK